MLRSLILIGYPEENIDGQFMTSKILIISSGMPFPNSIVEIFVGSIGTQRH